MKAMTVTAYVPLNVRHLSREQFAAHGETLTDAVGRDRLVAFLDYPLEQCWLYQWLRETDQLDLPGMFNAPPDRYDSVLRLVESMCVMAEKARWIVQAAELHPDVDVLAWIDYGVAKQGHWTGLPVTGEVIAGFMDALERTPALDHVTAPGIWPRGDIPTNACCWRFCGSSFVCPRQLAASFLAETTRATMEWVNRYRTVPIDVNVWAIVEARGAVPMRWYLGNHDATQFTGWPL